MGIGPNLDLGMSSVLKDPLYAALQHTVTRLKIIRELKDPMPCPWTTMILVYSSTAL